MPTMPRTPGKAKKIAYAISGVPANIAASDRPAKLAKFNRRLTFEETARVR